MQTNSSPIWFFGARDAIFNALVLLAIVLAPLANLRLGNSVVFTVVFAPLSKMAS